MRTYRTQGQDLAVGFRTVIVKSRVKLELRLNMLVIRGEQEKSVFINEIETLIIQSTAVSLTAALLSELAKKNIKVIFCDAKCNPAAELVPYYGSYNTSKRYKKQIAWRQETKDSVWQYVVMRKIVGQAEVLRWLGKNKEAEMLTKYAEDVELRDTTNREGHAAKVYFNALFGKDGSRTDDSFLNGCLNYGYAVLLSTFNREIVASGYLTQLGIWHDNEFNQFNLSCDLMEPFRPYLDRTALSLKENDEDFKVKMADVINRKIRIQDKTTTMDLAIRQYVRSALCALDSDDLDEIAFPQSVEWEDEL